MVSELDVPLLEVFLAIRTDGNPGDGTRFNPYDASTALQLDAIFQATFRENVTFRLAPGLFRTQGSESPGAQKPLRLKSGTKITGAGMFSTTLRLTAADVSVDSTKRHFSIISGPDPTHNVEISDLTIDCNLGDQPPTTGLSYALMSLDAVDLEGNYNSVRRVRVINFGNRTPTRVNGVDRLANSAESWPFFMTGEKNVIEDCVFEKPYVGSGRESTLAAAAGSFSAIFNNVFDGAFVNQDDGFVTPVDSITVVSGTPDSTIQVRTRFPHNVWAKKYDAMAPPDWIELAGSDVMTLNGRWEVTAPLYEDPVSRDLEFQIPGSPGTPTSKTMTVRQSFPKTMRVKEATWAGSPGVLTLITGTDHRRKVGDWVVINGAGPPMDENDCAFRGASFRLACANEENHGSAAAIWLG